MGEETGIHFRDLRVNCSAIVAEWVIYERSLQFAEGLEDVLKTG